MSNIHSLQAKRAQKHKVRELNNQRMGEACDWITKIDRELSQNEKNELKDWLVTDKDNFKQLLEISHIWDSSLELNRLADIFPQNTIESKPMTSSAIAIATSIIFVISLGLYNTSEYFSDILIKNELVETDSNRNLKTEIGKSDTFNLSDGSKIVLNTNTEVNLKFSANLRFIELKRGEIHIDVFHDKSRPLQVKVGNKIVQAVGTAFNIEVKDELVELIVTDGKVIIKDVQSLEQKKLLVVNDAIAVIEKAPTSSESLSETVMSVSKGEKINLEKKSFINHKVVKILPIEIVASLSWRQGNLIFRGESLQDAMNEISRYSHVKIKLANDQKLRKIQVAGMFRTGDIEGLLSMLQTNFNIEFERKKDHTIFLTLAKSI